MGRRNYRIPYGGELPMVQAQYHVIYDDDGTEWMVRRANAARASTRVPTKEEAIEEAADLSTNNRPSTVYIHYQREGEQLKPVQEERTYRE